MRVDRPEWHVRAACSDVSVELFFGDGDAVKVTCQSCEVREQCLSFGLYEADGVWGGLDSGERRKLRNR